MGLETVDETMPVAPSLLDRVILRLNLAPQLLLDVMAAGTLKAVVLASKLGIFEELSKTSLTSEEVAARVKADNRGVKILPDLLVSSGNLGRKRGRYFTSKQASKRLSRSSAVSLADMAAVWDTKVLKFWDIQLKQAVRNGRPSQNIFE